MLLLAAFAGHGQAQAQEHPRTAPSRDVDVIYRIAGPSAPMEQRMRWGVTLGKLRVDPPSPGLYVVIDTTTHMMQTVRESDRSVLQMNGNAQSVPGDVGTAGAFSRVGEATVAGLVCTRWETRDTGGQPVIACLTADGVLLRAEAAGAVLLEASEVHFEPQGEAVFRVPADYRRIIAPSVSQTRK